MADVAKQLEQLLKDAVKETGANLAIDAKALVVEMQASAARLAAAVGQPGYDQALRAERDVLAMKAGINAAINGDRVDVRVTGLVQGALAILVAAL